MKKKLFLSLLSLTCLIACNSSNSSINPSSIDISSSDDSSLSQVEDSSILSSSNNEVTALVPSKTCLMKDASIELSELFNISGPYTVELSSSCVSFNQAYERIDFIHAGYVEIIVKGNNNSASVALTILEEQTSFISVASLLNRISRGYIVEGLDYSYSSVRQVYGIVNPTYTYDMYDETGYGIFSDGNVYKFKNTAENTFIATGACLGDGVTWSKSLYQDFTLINTYAYIYNNSYYVPNKIIGTNEANPLMQAIIKQVGANEGISLEYIRIDIVDSVALEFSLVTSVENSKETIIGQFFLYDFGTGHIDDVEAYLKTAEIPQTNTNADVESFKAVVRKYINSSSYRLFGCDITDTDREIFYNYYSPTQYYEYYLGDEAGYIDLDNKVYNYTIKNNNEVNLGEEVAGKTSYRQIIDTFYDIEDTLFDTIRYSASDDCFTYLPSSDDGALASFLLHTAGYDMNTTNYRDHTEVIALLAIEDTIYVEIYTEFGEIKYQFDSLNAAPLPKHYEDFEFSSYAGTYTANMNKVASSGSGYEAVACKLELFLDKTGKFTFGEDVYTFTWEGAKDPTNSNKNIFTFSLDQEYPRGEYFVQVYSYEHNPNGIMVHFCYDENVTFRPSQLFKKVTQ